jgi:hypothetical protein
MTDRDEPLDPEARTDIVRPHERPNDPSGRPVPPFSVITQDPLDDRVIHGAGDPPRDPLADSTRRLVVDDLAARHGTEPDPVHPGADLGLQGTAPLDDPTVR